MPDLATQIRDYIDTTAAPVEADDLALGRVPLVEPRSPRSRNGLVAAFGAAVLVLVVIGGVMWAVGLSGKSGPAVTVPPRTVVPTTVAPVDPDSVPVSTAAANASLGVIDYAEVGERVGTMEVSFGSIEWWSLPRVPVAWVNERGFPSSSFTYPGSFTALYEAAPEDVEIFEVASGYVGLHIGDHPTLANPPGEFATRDKTVTPDNDSYFPAKGIWFSADGESWESMSAGPIEQDILVNRDPYVITEHAGRFVLIGWADSPVHIINDDEVDYAFEIDRVRPMAWVSDDLVTWERVVGDFDKPGMRTDLTSVVATDQGWFIFGVRATEDVAVGESRTAEWAAWSSPDGKVWEEFPIQDLLDAPLCTPTLPLQCVRISGKPAAGGVVVYAYEWGVSGVPGVEEGRTPGYPTSILVGLPR